MREADIQKLILHELNKQPDIFAWRAQSTGIWDGNGYRKKAGFDICGVSDILGVHKGTGRLIAIEVKTKLTRNRLRPEQRVFMSKINGMGGFARVVWEVEQVKELLDVLRNMSRSEVG